MNINSRNLTLNLTPNSATLYRTPRKKSILTQDYKKVYQKKKTSKQTENEKNLIDNEHKGYLSPKATKRLKNAINWLVLSSKEQKIKNHRTNKKFSFKISFITLTLPAEQGEVSDNQIKGIALKSFIQNLRDKYGMNAYVWKAEAQKNGNIHIHFTTNIYIPKSQLNYYWNLQLEKMGFIKKYKEKFEKMTYQEYEQYRIKQGTENKLSIYKAFIYGKATNWEKPNTTDIRNVKKVKNLAAYLATYFSKKDNEKRPMTGRIWGCSYNLSDKVKCSIVLDSFHDKGILDYLSSISDFNKDIFNDNEDPEKSFWLCTYFSFDIKKLAKSNLNIIKQRINEHINFIRYYNKSHHQLVIN